MHFKSGFKFVSTVLGDSFISLISLLQLFIHPDILLAYVFNHACSY